MADKYFVLRTADIQRYLSEEHRKQLLEIFNQINAQRRHNSQSLGDLFWPLNMKDQFALPALEAYISAVESDPAFGTVPELQAIAKAARERHTKAVVQFTQKLPT